MASASVLAQVPLDPALQGALPAGLRTFHCWGQADEIIAPDRSAAVAKLFGEPVVHEHPGGHVIPAAARKAVKQFLTSL